MFGKLSVPEAQHYYILCNIFGTQCGPQSILNWTRLDEFESILILYLNNVSLVFSSVAENIYRIHDFMRPLQRRCFQHLHLKMLLLWIVHLWRPAGLMNFAYEHFYFFCVLKMESITFVLCICSVYLNLILDTWCFT